MPGVLSINTLKLRLSALAQWHNSQGFADPTKRQWCAKCSRAFARCIRLGRNRPAAATRIWSKWLTGLKVGEYRAGQCGSAGAAARATRCGVDPAGLLAGFRSDELCRLQVEHVQAVPGSGISLYLPQQSDRDNLGKTFQTRRC
jgi:hypothetical protein